MSGLYGLFEVWNVRLFPQHLMVKMFNCVTIFVRFYVETFYYLEKDKNLKFN